MEIKFTFDDVLDARDELEKLGKDWHDYTPDEFLKGDFTKAVILGEYFNEWQSQVWISFNMRKYMRHIGEPLAEHGKQVDYLRNKYMDSIEGDVYNYYDFVSYLLTNMIVDDSDILMNLAVYCGLRKGDLSDDKPNPDFTGDFCVVWGQHSGTFVGLIKGYSGSKVTFSTVCEYPAAYPLSEIYKFRPIAKLRHLCVLDACKILPMTSKMVKNYQKVTGIDLSNIQDISF